jgi:hypothetical protein
VNHCDLFPNTQLTVESQCSSTSSSVEDGFGKLASTGILVTIFRLGSSTEMILCDGFRFLSVVARFAVLGSARLTTSRSTFGFSNSSSSGIAVWLVVAGSVMYPALDSDFERNATNPKSLSTIRMVFKSVLALSNSQNVTLFRFWLSDRNHFPCAECVAVRLDSHSIAITTNDTAL